MIKWGLIAALVFAMSGMVESGRFTLDLESGLVFNGSNDVRVPGTTGTPISLTNDLEVDSKPFYRARLTYYFNDRHLISAFAAPLRLEATGQLDVPVLFEDTEFPANTPLEALYRFDSYRLTYRYRFLGRENLEGWFGFTAKIRDAEIRLEGGGLQDETLNTGFVPLLSFRFAWRMSDPFRLILDGDALAAPQGRAEDVTLALVYRICPSISLRTGYRVLEGGADVESVYNFALLHFVYAAVILGL
jgi:hypothetical protein